MKSELQKQLIEASKQLAKCEGMENSKFELSCLFEYGEYDYDWFEIVKRGSMARFSTSDESDYHVYPWLKIDLSDKWCSAKFLARAGWDAAKLTLPEWIIQNFKFNHGELELCNKIADSLIEGNPELAYILAIILLYKIDKNAYNKGIKPLLKETK